MVIFNDLKYAVRLLAKRPGFTLLTTMVMAAGIGLSVYLFTFFNTALFKDLPFKDGGSLMQVSGSDNRLHVNNMLNLHDYDEIRRSVKGLSEFGAYSDRSVNVAGRDGARRYSAIAAEANIFQITRTEPVLGRTFRPAENQKGAEYVVVIGYDIWQNQFSGDPGVLDKMLRINGVSHRIIGVMPEGYFFPHVGELWVPLRQDVAQIPRGEGANVYGIAHLEEGVSLDFVNRQLDVIMQRLALKYPKTNNGSGAYVDTIPMTAVEDGMPVVRSMQVVAVLILILAGINVGNLLLSRAIERSKETAIRVALGAPRSRLISQMLWESIIVCTVGGLIGLLVMAWGLEITNPITAAFSSGKQLFWWKFGLDAFALKLFFAFLLAAIILTGLLPAWRNSGADFNSVLRDGTRGALGKKSGRLNRLLVISEIFISMTVLIAAGVIVTKSYLETHKDYGVSVDGILTAELVLTDGVYGTPEKKVQFVKTLHSRLENNEGTGSVMFSTALPAVSTSRPSMAIDGREYSGEGVGSYLRASYITVLPGTLPSLGVSLRQGRYFNSGDNGLAKRSVMVSESFATRYFPGQSPVGRKVRNVERDGDRPEWLTIVGVVADVLQGDNDPLYTVYRPYTQEPTSQITIALQMKADKAEVTRILRQTLQSIDPELPAFRIETFAHKLSRLNGPIRFISGVFLLFAIAAAILASSGIYGVMSNTITQRTQEIGVKRALGADEGRITREFLFKGFTQLLWGGVPGLLAGGGLGFAMAQIFQLGGSVVVVLSLTMAGVISFIVMLATYIPTRRALRMEPSHALHYE
ncbi:ABC transporter permease [Paremcibacter congregatus]|uniref:ABC transporter permease n=1 Tax=Paremcibacter congregatus TaxID=2043170 RepID=UPI003A95BBEF